MMISDEEYLKFIENGQKYALKILGEYFENDDEVVEDGDRDYILGKIVPTSTRVPYTIYESRLGLYKRKD